MAYGELSGPRERAAASSRRGPCGPSTLGRVPQPCDPKPSDPPVTSAVQAVSETLNDPAVQTRSQTQNDPLPVTENDALPVTENVALPVTEDDGLLVGEDDALPMSEDDGLLVSENDRLLTGEDDVLLLGENDPLLAAEPERPWWGSPPAPARPLRIAMLAPPWIPVPPSGYGGIEAVVDAITRELVRRGHEVTLFAAPGSRSEAKVVELLERPHPDEI